MDKATLSYSSRVVEVRNTTLHLLEGGEGAPLLFLHPAGGAGNWMPYHEMLSSHRRVIAPDALGFGRSPLSESVDSVSDLAFLYSALLDELGIEKVDVVGFSFGGWIAAELAVIDPKRINRLILTGAIGLRVPGSPIADLFAMGPQEKMAALFNDLSVLAGMFPSQPSLDDIVRFYREDGAFARYAWEPFCCNPKLANRLWRIQSPTLVLWGEHDRIVPLDHGKLYSQLIPNARLEIIPGVGHASLMERPQVGVQSIEQFLNN